MTGRPKALAAAGPIPAQLGSGPAHAPIAINGGSPVRTEPRPTFDGCRHALAASSGTAALTLSIMAARIPAGSLVACPGSTLAATPSAITLAGCRPILVKVDENLHLDLADLRRRWTPLIKAIVVVHMRGFAADMDKVAEFAAEHDVPVIENAVPALGADLNGPKLGPFGLTGTFSTQSGKSLDCGAGGFLRTDDTTIPACAVVLSGAFEGHCKRHFPDDPPPLDTDLDLPLGMDGKEVTNLLPGTTRYLQQAVGVPLFAALSPADCDRCGLR